MGIVVALLVLICLALLGALFAAGAFALTQRRMASGLRFEYGDIVDVDDEVAKRTAEAAELSASYSKKHATYERLLAEVAVMEEGEEMRSFGLYEPHFDFETAESYKEAVKANRAKQKQMVKDKVAAVCDTEWTVSGSKAKGRTMMNRQIRLMLRAFNGECDAAVMKARWNNMTQMETRMEKTFAAVNKLGETQQTMITGRYLELKIEELHLAHEYAERKYEEKEEQKEIRAQMREEERARREMVKAQDAAEKDEALAARALEKARNEVANAHGEAKSALAAQIAELEESLKEAHEKSQRALSQAQQTRRGHVYVVSNVGSFGEGVYKVGMTRRLEPLDRVKELGDASVPFPFDVHAMIHSTDAPALENALHKAMNGRRVNLVNRRKEFFRVSLSEISALVHENHGEIEFTMAAEARQYRESVAASQPKVAATPVNPFPVPV